MAWTDGRREAVRADAGVALLLSFALAVFLGFTAYWVFTELSHARAQRGEMLANFERRSLINKIFSEIQDAESAQRGYVISGQSSFLAPYNTSVKALPPRFEALEIAVQGQADQAARVGRLRLATDEKLAELDDVIGLREAGRAREAIDRVSTGRGRLLMDQIRQVIAELRDEEARRISASITEDGRRARQTERIILLLFTGMLLGAGAAVLLVRRFILTRQGLVISSQEEAARERAIFEAAMDGILVVDSSGAVERANPAAERIFNTAHQGLEGEPVRRLVEPGAVREVEAMLRDRRSAGRLELDGQRRDGSRFPLEVSVGELKGEGTALLFLRDISERRQVERMKDEFVSTVSHELRTPLTSIAGSLGLIAGGAAGSLPEKAARLIGIAQANSQRLVRLINDVLDLEKLESGKLPFNFTQVDLSEIVQRTVESVRGYADQLGVELVVAQAEAALVRIDPDRVVQIVTNLVSNAAKYSPKGGAVRISVSREGASARLTVADRGPGIPESFRDRIFTRFAQADASDARGKSGTGLGLYIAREIAERHGGRLWFDSPASGGATFHLDLPLAEEQPQLSNSRDRVLLVEDEPAAAALLTAILEHEGLKVDAVHTLEDARSQLQDPGRYGAMVLDLRLPDGDGMDLVKELRSRRDTRGIPIVVVSADANRGRDPGLRTLEVVEWMEKPVDPDRLAELVRGAVGPARDGNSFILHVDDDPDIREVVAAALSTLGEVVSADGVAQARAVLAERRPDLIVLDLELRDGAGLDLLDDLEEEAGPSIPVVVFSAQDTDDLGRPVAAVLVKSRTSLAGLVGTVRKLVDPPERPGK